MGRKTRPLGRPGVCILKRNLTPRHCIVAQGQTTQMAVLLGSTGIGLFASREVTGLDRNTALHLDQQRATDLLRPYRSNLQTIRELRTLLGNNPGAYAISDSEIITEIARKIASREVIVLRSVTLSTISGSSAGGSSAISEENEPEPVPAQQSRKSSSPAPPPELATLPSNTDGRAQTATAQQAAQDGVPFCEH